MLSSKDLNFVGYTYKNFEIVNDYQVPGMGIYLFSPYLCIIFYVYAPRFHFNYEWLLCFFDLYVFYYKMDIYNQFLENYY